MPKPVKITENMTKHLPKSELKSRKEAEEELRRDGPLMLRTPDWLSGEALKIWNSTRRKLRGIELLDKLDTEMLAIYCDSCANYRAASKQLIAVDVNGVPLVTDDQIKAAQAWARIVATYAEKLGLSPNGRARLARKKAVEEPMDAMDELLNDIPA